MAQYDLFRPSKRPWNTGRIIGAKPPLKPKHIWGIRQQLKSAHRVRDLALFNCAIDAKLRGCDLVKLRVSDVAPGGALRARATVIQQKTGRPGAVRDYRTDSRGFVILAPAPRPPGRLALPEPQPARRSHQHTAVIAHTTPD